MRMLLNVTFPHEKFNAAVRDGSAGSKISRILETIKPEAVYFTEQDGRRGSALVIVDVADPLPKSPPWPNPGSSRLMRT